MGLLLGVAVLRGVAGDQAAAFIIGGLLLAFALRATIKEQRAAAAAVGERMRDEHVPDMSPREYEQFAARLLEQAGWRVLHCGQAGDQGCDVLAELRGFKAVVQCKLYRTQRCGNAAVQQVVGARRHYGAQVMAVVAPSGFTRSAVALAATNGVHLMHHTALPGLASAARIP